MTGLEATTLLIRWEPALDHQVKSGKTKEGTHILISIPGSSTNTNILPANFAEDSYTKIHQTMMAVRNKWAINDSDRTRWEEWFKDK